SVELKTEAPQRPQPSNLPDLAQNYPVLVPRRLIVAVPEDLRASPDRLNRAGIAIGAPLAATLDSLAKQKNIASPGLTLSTRFVRLHDYLQSDLSSLLSAKPAVVSRVRLDLAQQVRP